MATAAPVSAHNADKLKSRIPAETLKRTRIEIPSPSKGSRHLEFV
jgi:hypothetical protein